jgi:5-methyltetrahydropteroyltriglutamate--homocysteine methyltransferase
MLLEFDGARSGPFGPLRQVPDDKMIVLGLVTTKTPRRETVPELVARLQEASRYVPLERLALSPQCGFATSIIGNKISGEDQQRKLTVIAQTAQAVWGEPVVSAAGSAR